MYTLYYSPGSASLAVHLALLETGAPHQLERLDLQARQHKTPAYLKLNPNGVVPTMLVDGRPVYECAALLMLLAERHPGAGLAPHPGTPERAQYLQWLVHFANTLQPAFRAWFYPAEPAGEEATVAAQESARLRIEATWDRLNAAPGCRRSAHRRRPLQRRRHAGRDADALVAQHAAHRAGVAALPRAGRARARAPGLEAAVRDRGPDRMGLTRPRGRAGLSAAPRGRPRPR